MDYIGFCGGLLNSACQRRIEHLPEGRRVLEADHPQAVLLGAGGVEEDDARRAEQLEALEQRLVRLVVGGYVGLQQLEVMHIADGNALFNMLQQYSGSIGTAAMSVIIAIAGSPYQGQSKQVVIGSQAAFIVLFLFLFTLLIFACILRFIKRDKQGLVKN